MKKTLGLICLVLVAGCGGANSEVKLTLPAALFKTGAASAQGVGMGAQLITSANLRKFADVNGTLLWREGDPNMATEVSFGSGQSSSASTLKSQVVPLLPIPSAKIRILNQSGKPLSLEQLQLTIKSSDGKSFPMYADLGVLEARVLSDLAEAHPALRGQHVGTAVRAKLGQIPYLNLKKEIANGQSATVYVSFDMTAIGDADGYLRTNTVQLVAGNLGAAGELQIPLTKQDVAVEMICPSSQHAANLERCHLESDEHEESPAAGNDSAGDSDN